ncbi:hypothetical protein CspeluHIS016_0308620 [Cutaneotrichosporon spelunceum]|uniref:Granulins domain-containing protein n=1 Tax=Cutaneotrichosporon spelunceum TaxID=1672016 RepID=A0AAD3YCJ5_9TREE|nr:hypothetical protein CspeluHIS016_0308620 [Cutaneotrichosporon spelunceum]
MILLFLTAFAFQATALGVDFSLTFASLQVEGSIDLSLGLPDFLTTEPHSSVSQPFSGPITDPDPSSKPYSYVHPPEFIISALGLDKGEDEDLAERTRRDWSGGPPLWGPNRGTLSSPTHSDTNPTSTPTHLASGLGFKEGTQHIESTEPQPGPSDGTLYTPGKRFYQPYPKIYDAFHGCCAQRERDLELGQSSADKLGGPPPTPNNGVKIALDLGPVQVQEGNLGNLEAQGPEVGSGHKDQSEPSYFQPGRRRLSTRVLEGKTEGSGIEIPINIATTKGEVEADEDLEVEFYNFPLDLEIEAGDTHQDGVEDGREADCEDESEADPAEDEEAGTIEKEEDCSNATKEDGPKEERSWDGHSAGCNPDEIRCTPHGTCLPKTVKCCKNGKTYCPESFYCINNGQSCCRVNRWCPLYMWGSMKHNTGSDSAIGARDSRDDGWALAIAMDFHL